MFEVSTMVVDKSTGSFQSIKIIQLQKVPIIFLKSLCDWPGFIRHPTVYVND